MEKFLVSQHSFSNQLHFGKEWKAQSQGRLRVGVDKTKARNLTHEW